MIKLWGERPDGREFSLGDLLVLPKARQGSVSGMLFIATKRGWDSSIAAFEASGEGLLGYSAEQWRYINGIKLPQNSVSWPREVPAHIGVGVSAAAALACGIARLNAWKEIIGEGPPPPDSMLAFVGLIPGPIERSFHLCILQFAMPISTALLMPFTQYEKDTLDGHNSGR